MSHPAPFPATSISGPMALVLPKIYRYIDQRYTNDFFETGALRLSSFSAFSKHTDEARQDRQEGMGLVSKSTSTVISVTGVGLGHNAYVLCGSTVQSTEVAAHFKHAGGIVIHDIPAFAVAISNHVPGFQRGEAKPCVYVSQRIVRGELGLSEVDAFFGNADRTLNDLLSLTVGDAGDELMFLKPDRYRPQSEYRMLWYSSAPTKDHLDIFCPEARKFCTPFLAAEKVDVPSMAVNMDTFGWGFRPPIAPRK